MTKILGIVGTGLIGGSIGLRARENGLMVLGADCSERALETARERGAIDRAVSRDELYEIADTIVLAAPVLQCVSELQVLAQRKSKATLIIDVASVKVAVIDAARGLEQFVGTHPMAGAERSGASAARPDLFAGRTWAYVPVASTQLCERAVTFINSMGANPLPLEAVKHDAIAAFTSHLPQLFATLFSRELARRGDESLELCGPVAHELQRLGRSPFAMWKEIIETNNANIGAELRAMAELLQETAAQLEARDFRFIESAFNA